MGVTSGLPPVAAELRTSRIGSFGLGADTKKGPPLTEVLAFTPAHGSRETAAQNTDTTLTVFTRRRAVALGMSAAALPSSLSAQAAWPTGPVTFVVGYAPGGSNDINARELARLMSPILGQQIVVDNKGGANGSLGLRAVAAAGRMATGCPTPRPRPSWSIRGSRRA